MFHIYRDDKNMKLIKCGKKPRQLHRRTSSALSARLLVLSGSDGSIISKISSSFIQ